MTIPIRNSTPSTHSAAAPVVAAEQRSLWRKLRDCLLCEDGPSRTPAQSWPIHESLPFVPHPESEVTVMPALGRPAKTDSPFSGYTRFEGRRGTSVPNMLRPLKEDDHAS